MTLFHIEDLVSRRPFNRTKLFADISAGRLVARKVGRSTIAHEADWKAYLEGTPRTANT